MLLDWYFSSKAGTEITTHYKLDMEDAAKNGHSQWYVQLWDTFSLRNCKIVDEFTKKVSERNYDDKQESGSCGSEQIAQTKTGTNEEKSEKERC
jgi:hypothetical protein